MSINRMRWLVFLLLGGVVIVNAARTERKSGSGDGGSKIVEYTIEAGDTLSGIAWKYHSSVKAIEKLNGLSPDVLLRPGRRLKIPLPSQKHEENGAKSSDKKDRKVHDGEKVYTVKAGDTLSQIAEKHGTSVAEMLRVNGMKKDALIRIGQKLKIPPGLSSGLSGEKKSRRKITVSKSPHQEEGSSKKQKRIKRIKSDTAKESTDAVNENEYVVKSGDTLFSIARKYRSSLKALMTLNGLAPTDIIKPGQVLKIPTSEAVQSAKHPKRMTKKIVVEKRAKKKKTPPVYHTVRRGDTLWKIADRYGVTIRQIRRLNGLHRGHIIHTGEKLMVKEGSVEPSNSSKRVSTAAKKEEKKAVPVRKHPRYYTVKHGDTLWEIARRQKLSLTELRKLNRLKKGELLHSGMKLLVGYTTLPEKRPEALPSKKKKSSTAKTKMTQKKKSLKKESSKKKRKAASKKSSRKRTKSADRRINNAMDVLNGRGSGGSYSAGAGGEIIRTAKRYLGRRYVWGAEGPSSFDCSGFTQYVMKKSKGITLPRISRKQAYYGKYVSFRNLRPGDLIFFDTSRSRRGYVNHVGIYIGNGKFIHASSARHRVVITSFKSHPFYRARFKWGRRVN